MVKKIKKLKREANPCTNLLPTQLNKRKDQKKKGEIKRKNMKNYPK